MTKYDSVGTMSHRRRDIPVNVKKNNEGMPVLSNVVSGVHQVDQLT